MGSVGDLCVVVVLPINYDTLYEVHLFVVIPVLLACLLLVNATSRSRGAALALLLLTTVLMRNELMIATGGLAIACAAAEHAAGWRARRGALLVSYGLPLGLALVVTGLFYAHSLVKFPELTKAFERKHTLNVCQIFAFGYQQRHPEWQRSPWTECHELMQSTFGTPEPSLTQAVRLAPRRCGSTSAGTSVSSRTGCRSCSSMRPRAR